MILGKEIRVALVGPGAVGRGMAALAKRAGARYGFWGRQGPTRLAATVNGVGLDSPSDQTVDLSPEEQLDFAADPACDLVFLTVKSYQLEQAFQVVIRELSSPVVVSLCNGAVWEDLEDLAMTSPEREKLRLGIVTFGMRPENGDIWQMTAGQCRWGRLQPNPTAVMGEPSETALIAKEPRFDWLPDARGAAQIKWLFNCVINSLCAVHNLPRNGDLLARPQELKELFAEVYNFGANKWGGFVQPQEKIWHSLVELIQATADNQNSMVQDLRNNRQLEVESLLGKLRGDQDSPFANRLYRNLKVK